MAKVLRIYREDGGLHRYFDGPEVDKIEIRTEDSGRFSVLLVVGHGEMGGRITQMLGNYGPNWAVTLDGGLG